jgi:hypothetical protein
MHSTLYSYSITCFIIPTEWTEVDNQRRTIQNKSKQKNKQWYTKHYIERKRSNNTKAIKTWAELRCFGITISSCATSGTIRFTLDTNCQWMFLLSSHLFLIWFVCFCWSDRSCYPIFHCVIYLLNVSNLEYHHLTMYLNWVTNIIHMTMFKIIAFSLTTLLTQVHLSVDILPTRGRQVHDPIISLRTETWYHRV